MTRFQQSDLGNYVRMCAFNVTVRFEIIKRVMIIPVLTPVQTNNEDTDQMTYWWYAKGVQLGRTNSVAVADDGITVRQSLAKNSNVGVVVCARREVRVEVEFNGERIRSPNVTNLIVCPNNQRPQLAFWTNPRYLARRASHRFLTCSTTMGDEEENS